MTNEEIKKVEGLMRSIKDFPAPGIIFRDITTILKDKEGLQIIIKDFTERYKDKGILVSFFQETHPRGFLPILR